MKNKRDISNIEVIEPELITSKNPVKMNKKIEKTAKDYQEINRKIKDLQAKANPLKKELIEFAVENKTNFDDAFQMKFENGTYISLRVKDFIEGTKDNKNQLLEETKLEYAKTELDEAAVLAEVPKNSRLRKLLTKLKLAISQKESYAVYAG